MNHLPSPLPGLNCSLGPPNIRVITLPAVPSHWTRCAIWPAFIGRWVATLSQPRVHWVGYMVCVAFFTSGLRRHGEPANSFGCTIQIPHLNAQNMSHCIVGTPCCMANVSNMLKIAAHSDDQLQTESPTIYQTFFLVLKQSIVSDQSLQIR